MPRYDHVLFDLDGTLIDSAPAILASYRDAFAAAGREAAVPIDASIVGPPLLETLHHALDLAEYEPFTVANDRCASCLHSDECGTGCRGYAYRYDDDWLLTDPRCAKTEPLDATNPPYFPLCPIMKLNVRSGLLGGSTEQALERSVVT